jgi:hypothetical protein
LSYDPDKPLQPSAFKPHTEISSKEPVTHQRSTPLVLGILLLVIVAFCSFVILPLLVGGPQSSDRASITSNTKPVPTSADSEPKIEQTPSRSPFSEAQRQKARKAAQDALDRVLDLQKILQELSIEKWAPEDYEQAVALAVQGDLAYREGNFINATKAYINAGDNLAVLESGVAERVVAARVDTLAAIEAGEQLDAQTALTLLTLLTPGLLELDSLSARVTAIPTVKEALAAAEQSAEDNQLSNAISLAKQALSADPAHQQAAQALASYQQRDADKRFKIAMTRGYDAIEKEKFDTAESFFDRAGGIRPASVEVQAAQDELTGAKTAAKLRALLLEGKEKESEEDWNAALAVYQRALDTDATLVFAQEGLARARPRAELATALAGVLTKQERLIDRRALANAEITMNAAQKIEPRGPVLAKQIQDLKAALDYARTPVKVTLISDEQTDVTLLRVGSLGLISSLELTLRPGNYVATGSRIGYRDVRISFTIKPKEVVQIDVRCTESI